ncbi:hypothetical protein TruAng_001970 [Truncatella angustata]|nr:hypothetical protein TruAng_001970 [Truncatella angustata]
MSSHSSRKGQSRGAIIEPASQPASNAGQLSNEGLGVKAEREIGSTTKSQVPPPQSEPGKAAFSTTDYVDGDWGSTFILGPGASNEAGAAPSRFSEAESRLNTVEWAMTYPWISRELGRKTPPFCVKLCSGSGSGSGSGL